MTRSKDGEVGKVRAVVVKPDGTKQVYAVDYIDAIANALVVYVVRVRGKRLRLMPETFGDDRTGLAVLDCSTTSIYYSEGKPHGNMLAYQKMLDQTSAPTT
jgi:hypothetical protein